MKQILKLNEYIDHTNLNPIATDEDIIKLCDEAKKYQFKSVCVNPCKISLCVNELRNSNVLICTVIGFPLGQNTTLAKVAETIDAIKLGANEIDMVINIAQLKQRNKKYCINEINQVVEAANGRLVKVIVETALLDDEDKEFAFEVVNDSKAHYIKTSTGFSTSGAKIEDINSWNSQRLKTHSSLKIKAAGGVSSYDDLIDFILAGSERIGTSRSVKILAGKELNPIIDLIINCETKKASNEQASDQNQNKQENNKNKKSEVIKAKEY